MVVLGRHDFEVHLMRGKTGIQWRDMGWLLEIGTSALDLHHLIRQTIGIFHFLEDVFGSDFECDLVANTSGAAGLEESLLSCYVFIALGRNVGRRLMHDDIGRVLAMEKVRRLADHG